MERKCDNCEWFYPEENFFDGATQGLCRRNPPLPFVETMPTYADDGEDLAAGVAPDWYRPALGYFPCVVEDWWCGEFKSKDGSF